MVKVLFVCTGNICRSPMAEGILRKKLDDAGLTDRVEVDSAATGAWHVGDCFDPRTEQVLHQHKADFDHCARVVKASDASYDYIFAMDDTHLKFLKAMFPEHAGVKKILDMNVPDPYYGTERDFEQVYVMLDQALGQFMGELKAKALSS